MQAPVAAGYEKTLQILLKKGAKLAFIGPHANSPQALLSNYHGSNSLVDSPSPLQAAAATAMSLTLRPDTK